MYLLLCAVVFLLLSHTPSLAATRYASTGGSGSTCSQASPCNLTTGIAQTFAGDTLYVRGGTYAQGLRTCCQTINSGTSESNRVIIAGYPGETVRLTGENGGAVDFSTSAGKSYITIDRIIFDVTAWGAEAGAIYVGKGSPANHHIRFTNCEIKSDHATEVQSSTSSAMATSGEADSIEFINCNIHGFRRYGTYARGTNWLFDGCDIHHNGAYGLHIYDSGNTNVSNNIVRNSRIHHNSLIPGQNLATSAGVLLSSGSNNCAYNNLIYSNGEGNSNNLGGIQFGGNALNNCAYNNTIYGNGGVGISVDTGSGALIKNNLIYNNSGNNNQIDDAGSGTTFDQNLCGGGDTGCEIVATPSFVNAGAADFHLNAGSPGINQGVTVSTVTTDFEGTARPQPAGGAYDIGAYERATGGAPPVVTTRYASPGGSGSTCSDSSPCSVATGLNQTAGGDTLYLKSGTYNLGFRTCCDTLNSGSSGAPTIIAGKPGDTVTLAGTNMLGIDFSGGANRSYITFKNFTMDSGASYASDNQTQCCGFYAATGNHHITLDGVRILRTNSPLHDNTKGMAVSGEGQFITVMNGEMQGFEYGYYTRGQNWLIKNNDVHDNAGYGIHNYSGAESDGVNDNRIEGNRVHHNGQLFAHDHNSAGILISSGVNNIVVNNLIYNHGPFSLGAIQVTNSSNSMVYNNTAYNNDGPCVDAQSNVNTVKVRNNLCVQGDTSLYTSSNSPTISNNMCSNGGTNCDIVATPSFVNTGANPPNLRLNAGSRGIDEGVQLSAVPTDLEGTVRPQPSGGAYDIGAFERAGGAPPVVTTRYSSPNGTGDCSQSAPCSLPTGMGLTVAGNTLLLFGGTYTNSIRPAEMTINSGTSAANTVTVKNVAGQVPIISPTHAAAIDINSSSTVYRYIVFDGLVLDGASVQSAGFLGGSAVSDITIQNGEIRFGKQSGGAPGFAVYAPPRVKFRNMKIHDNGLNNLDHGLYVCAPDMIIEENEFYNNTGYGLQLSDSANPGCANNVIIRNNRFHDNATSGGGAAAVSLNHGSNIRFYNNLVYNNAGGGVTPISGNADNAQIFNNTFYNNSGDAIQLMNASNTKLQNNLIQHTASFGQITRNASTGTTASNNLCARSGTDCARVGTATFTNAGSADFRLNAGSPGLDVGDTLGAVPDDYAHVARPQPPGGTYDIGAYERVQVGSPITVYVSPSGVDPPSRTCAAATSQATPLQTVGAGVACLTTPGSTLLLRAGTYVEAINTAVTPIAGGDDWTAPTTIAAFGNEVVTLRLPATQSVVLWLNNPTTDHYIIVNRLILDANNQADSNALAIVGGHHLRVQNSEMKQSYYEPVYVTGGDDVELIGNTMHHNTTEPCVNITNGSDRVLLKRNSIHDCAGAGIQVETPQSGTVLDGNQVTAAGGTQGRPGIVVSEATSPLLTNNIVYANDAGITLQSGTSNAKIYNNTVYGNTNNGIQIDSGVSLTLITNTISASNGGANIVPGTGTTQTTNLTTAPAFVNPGAGNFHLQPTATTAINMGTSLATDVPTDYEGIVRPQPSGGAYDIGASEFTGTVVVPPAVVKAFPTAEGFGVNTVGGRGGRVIEVKNLNDAGADSLRACVEATGPRTCVFRTGGTINLASNLNITNQGGVDRSFLTIAGQTAPGGGIQLKNWYLQIMYGAHDVIIRHLKIRPGAGNNPPSDPDSINNQCGGIILYGPNGGASRVYNIMLDHISMEWSCDDSMSMSGFIDATSIQWSLIGEGLNGNDYPGANSKGLLAGDFSGTKVSVHHNMLLDSESRNPDALGTMPMDFRNNLIYNWYACTGDIEVGRSFEGNTQFNFVGNVYLQGPHSPSTECPLGQIHTQYGRVYASDNRTPWCLESGTCGNPTLSQLGFVGHNDEGNPPINDGTVRVGTPFAAPAITMTPAANLESVLTPKVGAIVPSRDSLDTRLINDMTTRSGADGRAGAPWPTLAAGTPPTDTDHDGMPDSWETSHGLDPNNAADGASPPASNGYTNLENYLNTLAGDDVPLGPPPGTRTTPGTFWVSSSDGVDPPTRTCDVALNNINAPLLTLNGGRSCLVVAGDTLYLRGGTYTASITTATQPVANGSSWTVATTIAAYNGEPVTLSLPATEDNVLYFNATNQFIILDHLTLDCHNQTNSNGLAMAGGTHHIRFTNGEIKNCYFEPVYIDGSDNNEIRTSLLHGSATTACVALAAGSDNTVLQGNTIHTCAGAGIEALNPTSGTVMRDNVIHDAGTTNTQAALLLTGATNPVLVNNVAYANYRGLHLQTGTSGAKVYNNTLHGNATTGLQVDSGVTGTAITNNIVAANTTSQIVNNGASTTQTTNLTTAPPFDPALPNRFHLTSAATTAIDVGTSLTADVPFDYEGVVRPKGAGYDIGASEFVDVVTPPVGPPGVVRVPAWRSQGFFWR